MAIQMRRGAYDRFDPSRLLPGEWAIVVSGDSSSDGGRAAYVCFAPGVTKRVATVEDMATIIANAEPELAQRIVDYATSKTIDAESKRVAAESGRASAESKRVAAETARASAESKRVSAESSRASAESKRASDQARNNADQAQNNAAAQGFTFKVVASGGYKLSGGHNVPTGTGGAGVIYLTPNPNKESANKYEQWAWIDSAWELVGEDRHVDPVTTTDLDSISGGGSVTADRYLNAGGLTYLWKKLVAAFSPKSHSHAASDVSSGILPPERGGTGQASLGSARAAMGLGSSTGALAVAYGGTGSTTADAALKALGVVANKLYYDYDAGWVVYTNNVMVWVYSWGTATSSSSWATITCPYVIPEAYRPHFGHVAAPVTTVNGGAWTGVVDVKQDGHIIVRNLGNAGSTDMRYGFVCYPVGV